MLCRYHQFPFFIFPLFRIGFKLSGAEFVLVLCLTIYFLTPTPFTSRVWWKQSENSMILFRSPSQTTRHPLCRKFTFYICSLSVTSAFLLFTETSYNFIGKKWTLFIALDGIHITHHNSQLTWSEELSFHSLKSFVNWIGNIFFVRFSMIYSFTNWTNKFHSIGKNHNRNSRKPLFQRWEAFYDWGGILFVQ